MFLGHNTTGSPENHQFSSSHRPLNSHPPFRPHPPNFSAVPAPARRRMPRPSECCCRRICPSSVASAYTFARRCPRRICLAPKMLIFGGPNWLIWRRCWIR
ncbi:hypothetical protein VPH35_076584 [Triticum aestivum]